MPCSRPSPSPGCRRGEAVGATWAAADLNSGALEIRQTITKAGSKVIVKPPKSRRSRRVVPLPTALVAILVEHRTRQEERRLLLGTDWQDLDLVFPNDVGRYRYPDYVSTRFATYARRAGLPHIGGPHGLRHSLASPLDASGNGLATISALLGHASTAVTSKVYTCSRAPTAPRSISTPHAYSPARSTPIVEVGDLATRQPLHPGQELPGSFSPLSHLQLGENSARNPDWSAHVIANAVAEALDAELDGVEARSLGSQTLEF